MSDRRGGFGVAVKIARRELRAGLRSGMRGFRVFLACLALGVAAIAAVGSVRVSIEEGLAREGATILGGDAEITFTYRFADADERAFMEGWAESISETVDFRSMVVVNRDEVERGLTQVRGVDAAWPLYGDVGLDPPMPIADALAVRDVPGAVIAPLLVDRLGLSVGDRFHLGTQEFELRAILVDEPDGASSGFGLGPRTIVSLQGLEGSGLIQTGTLYESQYRLQLPSGTDLEAAETAFAPLELQGARWRDARNGAPGVARFIDRMGSFLVLVGLAGLAVGGVGVAAAVRAYLEGKIATIATLKTLGAERRTIFTAYFLQIGALTLVGVSLGLILGAAAPLAFGPLIAAQLPVPVVISLYPAPLLEAAWYGTLTASIFTLWPLARTAQVRAAALFRDASLGAQNWPDWPYLAVIGVLVVALVGSAVWLSGIMFLALGTAAGLLLSLALLGASAWGIRALCKRMARARFVRGRTALRAALSAVGGPGSEAGSVVLSLGLGLSVLAAVGQIDTNLRSAIQRDLPDVAPSYFFLDIQPDQLQPFLDRVEGDPLVSRVETAPMLRGVITQINGENAQEVAGDHWVLRGDRGVTYRAGPPPPEEITAGSWWAEDYAGPPQIAFATEEAAEMGLTLGDTLTLNILGRDITATIVALREVSFENAGIGFIVTMNEAALIGAPHSHIATVYAAPEAETQILRDVATDAPNVTAIHVRDALDRVAEALRGIARATSYAALATLLTGLIVLIGAAAAGERARVFEAAVLKTLGASRATILASFAIRAALLGAAAGIVAIAAGALGGWAVMRFVMETDYVFEPVSATAIIIGGAVATLLAGLAFAWRPLSTLPAHVLRAQD
ncbi:FtsX-like permease family protein [Gymnodinialimonas sp. 57CJ19]|uniref:ABC transporter permease n=1 Tax=Gymnodinialimonas sp. 57CJ19 TaxID=3138498 RepID=UPI0031344525